MQTQQKPRVYYEEAYPPVPLGFVKFMQGCTIWQSTDFLSSTSKSCGSSLMVIPKQRISAEKLKKRQEYRLIRPSCLFSFC
jgi:hypothetical protein